MELRQLRYFVQVAETLNFSEAARNLFVTQSTLSQQIKQLEQELDVQLLMRTSHSVSLTEAGSELLPYARMMLRDAQLCADRLMDLRNGLCGTLNVGVTYSFSPILTETLVDFMKQYPAVKLNVFYRPMAELMEMVRDRTVDFALAFRPSDAMPDIESHILFQNALSVIVGRNHPLASAKSVTLHQLAGYDLALPAQGLQARNALDRLCSRQGVSLNVRAELNEVNILIKLIRGTLLATVLAEATVHGESDVCRVALDVEDNEMTGCVHTLRNNYHKRSMRIFIQMLSESAAVRQRVTAWL